MDASIHLRIEELKTLIPQALQNCKKVADLPACVEDIKRMLDFSLEELGVKPEDVILLVTENLFY